MVDFEFFDIQALFHWLDIKTFEYITYTNYDKLNEFRYLSFTWTFHK